MARQLDVWTAKNCVRYPPHSRSAPPPPPPAVACDVSQNCKRERTDLVPTATNVALAAGQAVSLHVPPYHVHVLRHEATLAAHVSRMIFLHRTTAEKNFHGSSGKSLSVKIHDVTVQMALSHHQLSATKYSSNPSNSAMAAVVLTVYIATNISTNIITFKLDDPEQQIVDWLPLPERSNFEQVMFYYSYLVTTLTFNLLTSKNLNSSPLSQLHLSCKYGKIPTSGLTDMFTDSVYEHARMEAFMDNPQTECLRWQIASKGIDISVV